MRPQEKIVVVARGMRDPGRMDGLWSIPGPQPSAAAVHTTASSVEAGPLLMGGGEPTLRADLPSLIGQVDRQVTLLTDGLALHQPDTVQRLADQGLSGVRIGIHSARADAHDWLVGIPGAHRRIRKSVETLQSANIDVAAELVLTRPAMPYLEETIALFIRMGLSGVHIRMIERRGAATNDYVSLSPRLGLLQPALEAGLRLALRSRLDVSLSGVPHCAAPEFGDVMQPPPAWICPDGVEAPEIPEPIPGACPDCPASCQGLSRDYTEIFGWSEILSQHAVRPGPLHPTPPPESGDEIPEPPGRRGRQPATRLLRAITQSEFANLGGDPMAGRAPGPVIERVAVAFPPDEATRTIRRRMVQASQEGAHTLLLVGPMTHTEALPLLREALRLSFQQVILCGDVSALGSQPANQLFHLRGLAALWALDTPENRAVAARIAEASGVEVVHYRLIASSGDAEALLQENSQNLAPLVVAQGIDVSAVRQALAAHKESGWHTAISEAISQPACRLYGPPGTPNADINWPQLGRAEVS